ncbi:TPA: pseudouridine synthase, partial [Pseudomonas aeruginosa]|nr:pseudouridine synthase [Pseudomonas aeruginosa]
MRRMILPASLLLALSSFAMAEVAYAQRGEEVAGLLAAL